MGQNDNNPWNSMGAGLVGQAAGGALGAIYGLALEGHNDRRQFEQQRKLQELQMKGQKEMTDYNTNSQLRAQMQMWHDTSYSAQIEQMKKAGLNPALLYGMSGGGGQTVGGGISGGNVSGGQAASQSGETGMGIQMGLQQAMMMAQIELAKSQANKNNVEAGKIEGVDTDEAKERIENLRAGWNLIIAQTNDTNAKKTLTEAQTIMQNTSNAIQNRTQDASVRKILADADNAEEILAQAKRANKIGDETYNEAVKQIKLNTIQLGLENSLIKSQTSKTTAETKTINELRPQQLQHLKQVTQNLYETTLQGWDKMSQTEKEILIKDQLKDWETDPNKQMVDNLIHLINGAMFLKTLTPGGPTPVKGFGRGNNY